MGRIATVLAVVLVLACGSRNDNPTPIPAPGASSVPPPELPPDPGRVERIAWRAGPPFPAPRDHHVTFVTSSAGGGGWVWVAGGTDYKTVFRDVWRMRLTPEGLPSAPWERAGELPEPRAGLSVTQTGAMVILTGGQDSTLTKRTEVWTAAIKADGVLGAWSVGPPLPSPRVHHASAFHEGYVFVIGGLEARTSVATVHRSKLGEDGVLGPWDSMPPMPRPRSHHAAVVHDGALWLVAGLDGNPAGENTPLSDVIRSPFGKDGALGPWTTVSTLPHAYGTHAAIEAGNALWLLGGVEDNARFVDVVLRAPFEGDKLGAWEMKEPLPNARSHVHQVPRFGGVVYSVGGSNRRVVTTDTWVGALQPKPSP